MFEPLKSFEMLVSPTIKLTLSLRELSDERYHSNPELRRVIVYSDLQIIRDDNLSKHELQNIQALAIVGAIALVSEVSGHESHELYGEVHLGEVTVKLWSGEFKQQ